MAIKNLALNKEVFDSRSGNENRITCLTNGKVGVPSCRYAREWTCFNKDIEKCLFVDLGADFGVTSFDIGFIHDKQQGVCPPSEVKLFLSENGNYYYETAIVKAPYNASFDMCTRAVYTERFEKPIRARYAMLKFGIDGETFADELRIFGDECNGSEANLYGEPISFSEKGCFADPSTLDGVKDIFSAKFGGDDKKSLGIEDFISCVAFVDTMEMPRDIMSDALYFDYEGRMETLSDWEDHLDQLFSKNRNIDALDKVVELIKTTLELDKSFRYKIYIKTPSPKVSLDPFGDLNGDGITEKLLRSEDCITAYSWFLDSFLRRFNGGCYENLALGGFVWGENSLSRSTREDAIEFAQACVKEIHNRECKCIFIADFLVAGCEKAEYIGFDCTLMKPANTIEELAPICKKYGFGVALKTDNTLSSNLCGHIGNTVRLYDQPANEKNISVFAYSKNDSERSLYQKLYEFIKGGMEYAPPVCEDKTFSISELIVTPEPETAIEVKFEPETAIEVEPEPQKTAIVFNEPTVTHVATAVAEPIAEPEIEAVEEINPEPEPEIPPIPANLVKKYNKKHKKMAMLGAGVAATLGIAYVIAKAIKGRD